MPDFLTSEKVSVGGNALLKTAIIILFSIVLLVILLTYQSDENRIFDDIKKVKIGMTQSQVYEIMGLPKRNEKAPFMEERSRFKKNRGEKSKTKNKFLLAVQRDRYELNWFTSNDKADIYDFDVYYDVQLKVCYLNLWRTGGRLLIE